MTVDVLAIGAHPDDVEICCGGTLVKMARAGRRVGILHLTSGEAGTRGTSAERRIEAARAAEILGARELEFLALGDGSMRTGPEEEDQVIEVLRRLRPELVLGPATVDRHPDHERAYRVVAAACFYSGLARRGAGSPHRPAALFTYMQNDSFEPSFVVDVTSAWEVKMRALDAYGTQIHPGAGDTGPAAGPVTKISSRETRLMIEGRARHYGDQIGAEFGEPYRSRLPLAVPDPWQLLPQGVR
jgi:bacillithiol biosynthesis deacetylase BshB1